MTDELRAVVAAIALARSGKDATNVYDYNTRRHRRISGEVTANGDVSLYDYDRRCHIAGTLPSLFDYGFRKHLTVEFSGSKFDGFDYRSRKHFSGRCDGRSVSIYDYEMKKHYSYS